MCGLILLFRIRRLLRTSHSKFDVTFFRNFELGGLAQSSIKSMEFDVDDTAEESSAADASSVSEIAVVSNHGPWLLL